MNRIYQGKVTNRLLVISHWSFAAGAGDWSLDIGCSPEAQAQLTSELIP